MSIKTEIERLLNELPAGVKLLAVSKFHPVEALEQAYQAGQRAFGESRPQELKQKAEVLPRYIESPPQIRRVPCISPHSLS